MPFIENLLKKIEIKELAAKVRASVGPPGSMKKVDKAAMIRLMEFGGYHPKKERDLDLYLKEDTIEKTRILVLDNELAIYLTTMADVGLRKSPIVKEMIRPKNIKKIMNDSDVVQSRREDSVNFIEKELIDALDLSYTHADLDEIAERGATALQTSDSDGVIQSLTLFSELLAYKPAHRLFKFENHYIIGDRYQHHDGSTRFNVIVIYNIIDNLLNLLDKNISMADKEAMAFVRSVILKQKEAPIQGKDVFAFLKSAAKNINQN